MADLRFGLLIATALAVALVACSSDSSPSAGSADVVVERAPAPTRSEEPPVDGAESRQAFRRLAERTKIAIDGVDVSTATAVVECFAGQCSSPLAYGNGVELVVATDVDLRFEHPDIELAGSARRLSEHLRFLPVDGDGLATFRFSEPGLYHLEVSGEVRRETGATDRFHHFAWVQVAENTAHCSRPLLSAGSITGVTDRAGCPSDEGKLNFDALHPDFHCDPWPAQLRMDLRPGSVFIRAEPNPTRVRMAGATATGLFLAGGSIFAAVDTDEIVYVLRTDETGLHGLDRWVVEESEIGCD